MIPTLSSEVEVATEYLSILEEIIDKHDPQNETLLSGLTGKMLYHFYGYQFHKDESYAEKGVAIFEHLFHDLQTNPKSTLRRYALSFGFSGFGYAVSLLNQENIIDIDINEHLMVFDEYVYTKSLEEIKAKNTDFLHGPLGVMYYLSMRLPNEKVKKYLEELVVALSETAITDQKGIRFPNTYIAKLDENFDDTNFGLAHGLTGILLVLIELHQKGVSRNLTKKLVFGGIEFMLNYKTPVNFEKGKYSMFPLGIDENYEWDNPKNLKNYHGRLGWCYGDLNQAILLYKAAKAFNRPDWLEIADEVGITTTIRKNKKETIVVDSCLCHGAGGLSQIYKRLYEMSGRFEYSDAHYYWLNRTFEYIDIEKGKEESLEKASHLLGGLIGAYLAILSAVSDEPYRWDSIFLIA